MLSYIVFFDATNIHRKPILRRIGGDSDYINFSYRLGKNSLNGSRYQMQGRWVTKNGYDEIRKLVKSDLYTTLEIASIAAQNPRTDWN